MRSTYSRQQVLFGLALLCVICLIWAKFLNSFIRIGTTDDPHWPVFSEDSESNSTERLSFPERMHSSPEMSRVIAEQNIFSTSRSEWVAPQPRKEPDSQKQPRSEKGMPRIVLQGVSFMGTEPRALLHFASSKPAETLVVGEGEFVSIPGGSEGSYLMVTKIDREYVLMNDDNGYEIKVGLHDHRRTILPSAPMEPRIFVDAGNGKSISTHASPPAKRPVKPAPVGKAGKAMEKKSD